MVRVSTIVEVIPELVPVDHKMVLDAGCGVGTILEALKSRGADIWGIEPGADNIAIARQRNPDISEQFQVAGAEDLPFDANSFDVVVFSNSLHHVPIKHQAAALSESARVLKPGGYAVVAEPVPEGPHFNLSLPMEDETDVRNHALAAILDTDAHGMNIEKETSFIRATGYGSYQDYKKAMIQVDPGRAQAFEERGDQLQENFATCGRQEGNMMIFDQEIRVHLLRKPEE